MDKVKSVYYRVFSFFKKILEAAFGEINWHPPVWIYKISDGIKSGRNKMNSNPRQSAIGIGIVAAVVVGSYYGYEWYKSRPQPVRYTFSFETLPTPPAFVDHPTISSLTVGFSGSVAEIAQIGKKVTSNVMIAPKIEGEWMWLSDRKLQFAPKDFWPVGQKYDVSFNEKLFPSHVKLEEYQSSFETPGMTYAIASAEFYQDPTDPTNKRLSSKIEFNYAIDPKDFEKSIEILFFERRTGRLPKDGKAIPFTVSFNKFKSEAYVLSDVLKIPDEDSEMSIRYLGDKMFSLNGHKPSKNANNRSVHIPGKSDFFKVSSANINIVRNEKYDPEYMLTVETTADAASEVLANFVSVWVLPKYLDPVTKRETYHLWQPAEMTPDVLSRATKMKFKTIPTERPFVSLHSFKMDVKENQQIYVRVEPGAKSFGDYDMFRGFDITMVVPQLPQELNFMHEGSILTITGDKKLNMVSRGLKGIQLEVSRVLPDQINHLITQTSGNMQNRKFADYNLFTADNVSEVIVDHFPLANFSLQKANYTAIDFKKYLGQKGSINKGVFLLSAENWNPETKYVEGNIKDERLVFITDLGIIAKVAKDGTRAVFVQSLQTGKPISGVRIEIIGKNGLPILSDTTNADGRADFPSLADYHREKAPVAYLAQKGNDLSFLPLDTFDRRLDHSRFDIGGIQLNSETMDQLRGFVFSDRGLYRPGDDVNLAWVVKNWSWSKRIAGLPLELNIINPRGSLVLEQKIELSKEGFGDQQFHTDYTSPTGTYTASLYLVKEENQVKRRDFIGSTTFKVEEFVPDRMKISLQLSREKIKGWTSLEELKANVKLTNLFGTAAEGRRVVSKLSLSPFSPHFKEYEGYYFVDPHSTDKSFDVTLDESETNEKGEAEVDIDLSKYNAATYRLQLVAEGFEAEGGRSVSAQASVIVSPLKYLVGFKTDQNLSYVKKDATAKVNLIAVDADLKQISVKGLKKKLMRLDYVNVLMKQPDGTLRYQSVKKEIPVSEKDLEISEKGTVLDLEAANPGNYVYVIVNSEGKDANKIFYSVAGSANLTRSLDRNAELQIKIAKDDINPGDNIEFQVTAPYAGAGLITIEREKVIAQKWFVSDKNATTQSIRIPDNIEGGAYISVFWLRSTNSPEIFMSPLSHATVPFQINRDRRMQKIKLEIPELVKPGQDLEIKYSSNKNSKIILWGVDEGILQVARYNTPDPLTYFFQKMALQVQTFQILDLLLPEFNIVKKLLAPGGDEGKALAANLNPFKRKTEKPVAFWSGVTEVSSTPKTYTYQVPDYFNGQIRVMAIAVNEESIGRQSQKATVRGDMVISPNVPFFSSPGDEFDISVGVTNALVGSGEKAKLDFTINMSEHFELVQKPQESLSIPEGREGVVKARLKTKNTLGAASITFVTTQGSSRATYTSTVSVRPAVAYMTTLTGGYTKDSSFEVPTPRQMYPHFRKLEFGVSMLPLGLGHGLLSFLDEYPYGCTEQLTSKAFPAVALGSKPDFGFDQKKVEKSVANAIQNLRGRQISSGGYAYWPGNRQYIDFSSVYAAHYLTEARSAGYSVPTDLTKKTIDYLSTVSNFNTANLYSARIWAYAIYLQARNGVLPTNDLNRLRQEVEAKYPKEWQKDLTGAFLAATYKLMKQDAEAGKLISAFDLSSARTVKVYEYFYDANIGDAYALFLVAKHFPEKLKKEGLEIAGRIAESISKRQYSTISTAISLLAFGAMAEDPNAASLAEGGDVEVNEYTISGGKKEIKIPNGLFPKMELHEGTHRLKVENPNKVSLFYLATQAGFDNQQITKEIKEGAEIIHEITDEKGKKLSSVKLGEEVFVHLRVRSLGANYVPNVALVDLIPSGFELVLDERLKVPHQQEFPEGEMPEGDDQHIDGEGEGEGDEGASFNFLKFSFPQAYAQDNANLSSFHPDYVDRREDRVVLYGTIKKELTEYIYKIKATNKGSFVVPASFLEHMYDKTVHARSMPDKISVVEPK